MSNTKLPHDLDGVAGGISADKGYFRAVVGLFPDLSPQDQALLCAAVGRTYDLRTAQGTMQAVTDVGLGTEAAEVLYCSIIECARNYSQKELEEMAGGGVVPADWAGIAAALEEKTDANLPKRVRKLLPDWPEEKTIKIIREDGSKDIVWAVAKMAPERFFHEIEKQIEVGNNRGRWIRSAFIGNSGLPMERLDGLLDDIEKDGVRANVVALENLCERKDLTEKLVARLVDFSLGSADIKQPAERLNFWKTLVKLQFKNIDKSEAALDRYPNIFLAWLAGSSLADENLLRKAAKRPDPDIVAAVIRRAIGTPLMKELAEYDSLYEEAYINDAIRDGRELTPEEIKTGIRSSFRSTRVETIKKIGRR